MGNLIRGEFYKLNKSKYFIVLILMSVTFTLLAINSWYAEIKGLDGTQLKVPIDGVYSIRWIFEFIPITGFIFALLAGEFIAKDFKNSKVSKSFTYGYSRSTVVISKFLVFIIASLFLQIIYTTFFVLYVSFNCGFSKVLDLNTVLYLIRTIIIGLMFSIATMSIIGMVAIVTKSVIFTVSFPIIFILSYELYYYFSFSPVIEFICPYIIGSRALGPFAPSLKIIKAIMSSILVFIITVGISVIYVKHQDFK